MKLRSYLYEVKACDCQDGIYSGAITLIPECPVYSGHFKGMPITPGACITRIAEELTADSFPQLRLSSIRDIRFLSVITPLQSTEITYKFSIFYAPAGQKRVDFSFNDGEVTCAKLSFLYD